MRSDQRIVYQNFDRVVRVCRLGVFGSLILVAGCGSSGPDKSVGLLHKRLQTLLAAEIAGDQAVVQPLPDGARVTLLGSSVFPTDVKTLADQHPDIRAEVIEALLDPTLMHIEVADTGGPSAARREERIRNFTRYFVENGLGSTLGVPAAEAPSGLAGAGPVGLTITITVQCPERHSGFGYGDGKSNPTCD